MVSPMGNFFTLHVITARGASERARGRGRRAEGQKGRGGRGQGNEMPPMRGGAV